MHVLIATTGALDPELTVAFTGRLIVGGGRVTVATVVGVPHEFLDTLEQEAIGPRATPSSERRRYLEERGRRATEGIQNAFAAAGIDTEVVYLEGDDPADRIAEAARDLGADIVVLGATRQLFDQSSWESVSARLMLECDRPVLVVPARIRQPQEA